MVARLVAGQNLAVADSVVTVRVSAGSVSAMVGNVLLEAGNRNGVTVEAGCVTVDLATAAAPVPVLCIASASALPPVLEFAVDGSASIARFDAATTGLAAVVGIEFYSRGGSWKIRAVGQGYAGGLAELARDHGAEVTAAPTLDRTRILERIWMIYEDAARSGAAHDSAVDFADERLTDELSTIAGDPAARSSNRGDDLRAAAQLRHDSLVATAQQAHLADSRQLTAELVALDTVLPAAAATWASPAWQSAMSAGEFTDCIRIGAIAAPHRSALQVPMCLAWPTARPWWIADESGGTAAVSTLTSLVLRVVAAAPPGMTDVVVVDIAASGCVDHLGPLVTSVPGQSAAAALLDTVANRVDLWHMAIEAGEPAPPLPARTALVLVGFPFGYTADDLARIGYLAANGPHAGVSLIVLGGTDTRDTDPLVTALLDASTMLPAADDPIVDPWVHGQWTFIADGSPAEVDSLVRRFTPPL